jgi:hypothetical protein
MMGVLFGDAMRKEASCDGAGFQVELDQYRNEDRRAVGQGRSWGK